MHNYDDIINLEHFEPKFHKRMSILSRAAQFSPYDALNGYGESIKEIKRKVNKKINLTNEEKLNINNKLINLKFNDNIKVLHFIKDRYKDGGEYISYNGIVLRIDKDNQRIIFNDKTFIYFDNILELEILNNF